MSNKETKTYHSHKPIIAKLLSLFLAIMLLCSTLASCEEKKQPTAEELIEERITTFLTAYNDGDMEEVLECLDTKSKNKFNALLNVMGGIVGGLTGYSFDLRDLFSLGVTLADGDFMNLSISKIEVSGDKAVATTQMSLYPSGHQIIYFSMVKENDGWFISDMTDKKNEIITNNNSNNTTNKNTVKLTSCNTFVDGIAEISYTEEDTKYFGIINEQGKIIYATNKKSNFTPIGKGSAIVSLFNEEEIKYDIAYIIDINGNIVKTFENDAQLLAYGDGLALIYQTKSSITEFERLYEVFDHSGNTLSVTKMNYYPQTSWGEDPHYYMGNGVFAIMVKCWAGTGGDDFVFLNGNTGETFFISRLNRKLEQFTNGTTFVYGSDGWSEIITPYDKSENNNGVEAPEYYLLHDDGTYEEYNMNGKTFLGYSSGFLWYTVDGDENDLYIEDITTSSRNIITYNEYRPSRISSISFKEKYGLLTIVGADSKLYFTLIDKNGKQQFEPIETTGYTNLWFGYDFSYSNEAIVFENADKKYCIADEKGNIIVTDYTYISEFSNDIALACIGEHRYDPNAEFFYINKSGEKIVTSITKP